MKDIEEHIRKALEEGKFDDLPGKGKPLNLDDNPLADPEWRLAHHMLRSSGYTLPWIALRQEIETELEVARHELELAWRWRQNLPAREQASDAKWQRAENRFRQRIEKLNKQIFDYNLQAPVAQVQLLKINPEKEIERIRSTAPPG